jgi:hypothetical protein
MAFFVKAMASFASAKVDDSVVDGAGVDVSVTGGCTVTDVVGVDVDGVDDPWIACNKVSMVALSCLFSLSKFPFTLCNSSSREIMN